MLKFDSNELIAWREGMGFSQREAADRLGCSRGALRGWESGEQSIPRYIQLACHALALGFDEAEHFDTDHTEAHPEEIEA